MKKIEYYIKRNYGTDHKYIKNDEMANAVSTLTGRKTIDSNDIIALRTLGFDLVQVLEH